MVSINTTKTPSILDVIFELSYIIVTSEIREHLSMSYFQSLVATKLVCWQSSFRY